MEEENRFLYNRSIKFFLLWWLYLHPRSKIWSTIFFLDMKSIFSYVSLKDTSIAIPTKVFKFIVVYTNTQFSYLSSLFKSLYASSFRARIFVHEPRDFDKRGDELRMLNNNFILIRSSVEFERSWEGGQGDE